ncbi:MAG: ribonuclease HII [Methanomassiliicoccales archaeon]|nr:MAG: ribonuclease HII [Methanomassiliicoccales archaeon]
MRCGLDEAGRGPVIGPLVIAAVMVDNESELRKMGVKDSKRLMPSKRSELAKKIKEIAEVNVCIIDVAEIDSRGDERSLNELEIEKFAELIVKMRPKEVFIDACDPVEENFRRSIMERLDYSPDMVCEHKADQTYPVVSAASIVAKVTRDELVKEIGASLGCQVGSGYPGDDVTIEFIKSWIKEKGDLPPHTRRSWETSRRLLSESKIRKLTYWE